MNFFVILRIMSSMDIKLFVFQLKIMSSIHETQPTIQRLLSDNEFIGALDLISTSQDVLNKDLCGIHSFRCVIFNVSPGVNNFFIYYVPLVILSRALFLTYDPCTNCTNIMMSIGHL